MPITYSHSLSDRKKQMADFVTKSVTKSAVREYAVPIDTLVNYNALIQSILTDNPWNCTSYQSAGETIPAVKEGKEYVSGKIVYENTNGKQVGYINIQGPDSTGFATTLATILANEAINTAMGGTPSHDSSGDKFSTTLSCHDTSGEIYSVAITRTQMTVSGYEADSILAVIETWADTKPLLA
jgi:hypothetical protein